MKKKREYSYNERLFSSGIRKKLHTSRFYWVANSLISLQCRYESVLELGCFDGKIMDYLPSKPLRYLGLDANWEGGLNLARERWGTESGFRFEECHTPQDMNLNNEMFDISLCMDTLEHVPPAMVEPYLYQLSQVTRKYILISVPNEKGIMFLLKFLVKKLFSGDTQDYTFYEAISATLGRMENVVRREHKGFDYETLLESISKNFKIYGISGYPFPFLPVWLNFGVGIIGVSYRGTEKNSLANNK